MRGIFQNEETSTATSMNLISHLGLQEMFRYGATVWLRILAERALQLHNPQKVTKSKLAFPPDLNVAGLQSFLSDSSYAGDVRFPIVRHPLTMD